MKSLNKNKKLLFKSRDNAKKSLSYDLNDQSFLNKIHSKLENLDSLVTPTRGNSSTHREVIFSSEYDGTGDQTESIIVYKPNPKYQTSSNFKKIGRKNLETKIDKMITNQGMSLKG